MKKREIEIMSPAGSFESLYSAIKAGANSVYFGIDKLNMRARAAVNFTIEDLEKIVKICNENSVKTYLTVNIVLYNHDLKQMKKVCDSAKKAGITAIIAADISAIQYANSIDLQVHISTQANVSNIEAVKFYSKFSDVVVLARELTFGQIKDICETIKNENILGKSGELLRIEIFVHGALCVAISGKCYMSLATHNSSANRGACLQNCRRTYRVIEEDTGNELVIDNKFVMSPKDLCTVGYIDKILEAGVCVLKIEGRGRSADYVYTTTKVYREASDSYLEGDFTKEKIIKWIDELKKVFNRGFWYGGYYLGKKQEEWSASYGSQSTKERLFVGRVVHYYPKVGIAEIKLETKDVLEGEEVCITGPTTGILKEKVAGLRVEGEKFNKSKKGDIITFKVSERVRKNDKLFVIRDRKYVQNYTK
ncbi:MAG: U32 family peptidase [Candidatus Magasanikbacteria bacterium]|nr:U32 family peptidase [Candidatus Magasanikbacteria bacterium]